MMEFSLPTSIEVCGTVYEVRSDYRAVLDICTALSDPELSSQDKGETLLEIFYPGFDEMPPEHYQEAINQGLWFINGGELEEEPNRAPKLVDWERDFRYIVGPVNRVLGCEIRAKEYDPEANTGGLHWWTFLAAYYEIGECLFAQIVNIRNKKARGKKLDKNEQEWYERNRRLVDFPMVYTEAEQELLKSWGI